MKKYNNIPELLLDINLTNDVLLQKDPTERVQYLIIIDSETGCELSDCEILITLNNNENIIVKQPVIISCNQTSYLYSCDEMIESDDCFNVDNIKQIELLHGVPGIRVQYEMELCFWNYSFLD